MAKFKEVNACPPPEATQKCKYLAQAQEIQEKRKDLELMPGGKKN